MSREVKRLFAAQWLVFPGAVLAGRLGELLNLSMPLWTVVFLAGFTGTAVPVVRMKLADRLVPPDRASPTTS